MCETHCVQSSVAAQNCRKPANAKQLYQTVIPFWRFMCTEDTYVRAIFLRQRNSLHDKKLLISFVFDISPVNVFICFFVAN